MPVTTYEQAKSIQEKRVKNKQRGYAKAVRTFVQSISKVSKAYRENLSMLPVYWGKPAKSKIQEVKKTPFNWNLPIGDKPIVGNNITVRHKSSMNSKTGLVTLKAMHKPEVKRIAAILSGNRIKTCAGDVFRWVKHDGKFMTSEPATYQG